MPPQVAKYAGDACAERVSRHLFWRYDEASPFDADARHALQLCAASIDAELAKSEPVSQHWLLANFSRYLQRTADQAGYKDRQAAMAENLAWLIEHWPQGTRVLVWTANVHAAKVGGARATAERLMRDQQYSIFSLGVTALAGENGMVGTPARELSLLPSDSLEGRGLTSGAPAAYLATEDLRALAKRSSRLLGKTQATEWAEYFDGVLILREVTPPNF